MSIFELLISSKCSSKFDKLDDIGLIIYPHVFKQFMLSDNPNMELFNESKDV